MGSSTRKSACYWRP